MGLPNEPTFLVPSKKLTHGVFRKFGFLKDHRRFWAKKRGDKVVNISFSQESLDCVVVRKPLGFLPVRSKTANAQGSSLTFRNPFSCADSAKKQKGGSGMVSLPQIHHQFAIGYFPRVSETTTGESEIRK